MDTLEERLAKAAGYVKLTTGVANNAAWVVALTAYDHAKLCRRYAREVKKAFSEAVKEWHNYERRLLSPVGPRMFHLEDFDAKTRERYGNITDREYYEAWASIGFFAYKKTQPWITSLWNKHRLSLLQHHVEDAEHVAWVLTALSALYLAQQIYQHTMKHVVSDFLITRMTAERVFLQFSLAAVLKRWQRALLLLAPEYNYTLESTERKNIENGLRQLCEAWTDMELLCEVTIMSVEDNEEVFKDAKTHRKVLRQLKK